MSLDTPVEDMCQLVDGRLVTPIKWFGDGRVFCRMDERADHGWISTKWKALSVKDIQGASDSLTRLIGVRPVNLDSSGVNRIKEFGLF